MNIGFILALIGAFLFGVLIGAIATAGKDIKFSDSYSLPEKVDNDGYTKTEKHSYYRIVRYVNNHFDCIWESRIYDKRVADKRCKRLNDPNQGNEYLYGTYVVELE